MILKRKNIFWNTLLFILAFGVALFSMEFLLRHYYLSDSVLEYRVPHRVFGWTLEPDKSYLNRMKETTVPVSYNSQGFRDVEHTKAKDETKFRVLVLGDSFMEAYSVALEDSFSRKSEKLLNEAGKKVEVINMGVGGYGTLQEYLLYNEVGKLYAPDLVLLGVYLANDLSDNSFDLQSLMYSGMMKVDSRPFLKSKEAGDWEIRRVNFERSQKRYSEAKSKKDAPWGKLVSLRLLSKIMSGETKGYKRASVLAQYGIYFCEEPVEYTKSWNITSRILRRLKSQVEDTGSHLVVFSVPALEDTDSSYRKAIKEKIHTDDPLCFEKYPGYDRLKSLLKGLQIDYINLLNEFRKGSSEGKELFRRSDRHWNEEGHSLAAEMVIFELSQKQLLP